MFILPLPPSCHFPFDNVMQPRMKLQFKSRVSKQSEIEALDLFYLGQPRLSQNLCQFNTYTRLPNPSLLHQRRLWGSSKYLLSRFILRIYGQLIDGMSKFKLRNSEGSLIKSKAARIGAPLWRSEVVREYMIARDWLNAWKLQLSNTRRWRSSYCWKKSGTDRFLAPS